MLGNPVEIFVQDVPPLVDLYTLFVEEYPEYVTNTTLGSVFETATQDGDAAVVGVAQEVKEVPPLVDLEIPPVPCFNT